MPSATTTRGKGVQLLLIAVGILGVSLAHYVTPAPLIFWHNVFQRLYYLPVVYAAVVFGWTGGLLAALLSGLCYAPHILTTWQHNPEYVINQYAEIVLFFLVGVATGLLAEEQRAKRAKLEEYAVELERVNRELRESFEQLKRADRLAAVGNLAAGLAHEIRNPLASIEGAAGILERGPVSEERRREFLGIIKKECSRLNRLLGNLLDFARPREPQRQRVPLEPLLDSVIDLVAHSADGRRTTLRKEIAEPGMALDCDGEQLKQVVLNLLLNAAQAMPDGGDIRLVARPEKSDLVIEVVDQGSGIAPENQDKVFNPFFTTKESGTGLGLAVAHQIVSQHGGTLRAQGNPDRGMTFSIRLPGARENP
jgi:signal transduction histidine kinase